MEMLATSNTATSSSTLAGQISRISETIRVLLVEDNPGDARLTQEMLKDAGGDIFHISHVERLQTALTQLYDQDFDVVLLDLGLPDAHGLGTVTQIRCTVPTVPVVVLSGIDDQGLASDALQSGAQDYLVKGQEDARVVGRALRYAVQRKRSEQQLTYLAHYDHLTGLANRGLFHDRLVQGLARSSRRNSHLALMYVDLDCFKTINDKLGHDAGDVLLQVVAERLKNCVRKSDTVARLGGDEFTVILEDIRHGEAAAAVARKILDNIRLPISVGRHEVRTTGSIGIALWPHRVQDPETLVKNADAAMYQAKQQGGDRYRFYTDDMDDLSLKRLELETDLRKAVAQGEFRLLYQPQVDLMTGRINGIEALLRWQRSDTDSLTLPGDFIPVAEETGLIVPIGEWVLHTACLQSRSWCAAGLPASRVSINLSVRQLEREDLAENVDRILKDTGMNPRDLELEVTETVLMTNASAAVEILARLKAQGLSISVDDFGTGFASLSYLRHLPLDTLKMDQSFIRNLANPVDAALAKTIVHLAHILGLRIVAEGVETEAQLDFLRDLAPLDVQGFVVSHPEPADALTRMMHLRNQAAVQFGNA